MKKLLKDIGTIVKRSVSNWLKEDPFRLSAVVAYYAVFALPGLMVIVLTVSGLVFDKKSVQGVITEEVGAMIGPETANTIEVMIANAIKEENSTVSLIVGIVTLLFGATGVFVQLQKSLNNIWGVVPKESNGLKRFVVERLVSFGLILAIGFLLLISLVLTAAFSAFNNWFTSYLPEAISYVFYFFDLVASFIGITFLFALMFKFLPDIEIAWKPVLVGAIVTTILFLMGKYAIGLYFGKADPASGYGAAGSVILILLWVSYTCMIVFLGAEFTRVFSHYYNYSFQPSTHADIYSEKVTERTETGEIKETKK